MSCSFLAFCFCLFTACVVNKIVAISPNASVHLSDTNLHDLDMDLETRRGHSWILCGAFRGFGGRERHLEATPALKGESSGKREQSIRQEGTARPPDNDHAIIHHLSVPQGSNQKVTRLNMYEAEPDLALLTLSPSLLPHLPAAPVRHHGTASNQRMTQWIWMKQNCSI